VNITAYILLGLGVGFSLLNWLCLFGSWFSKRHISPVFPAPSVFTALGLALLEQTRAYWWVGLLTDYTFFALLIVAPRMVAEAWRTSIFTRVQLLVAEGAPRRLELSLHRGGHFLLRATFEPPMSCDPHGACIMSFGAVGHWQEMLDGHLRLWGYREERVLTLERADSVYIAHEDHYPVDTEFPYDALDGVVFRLLA
jgi:hypothetical protein